MERRRRPAWHGIAVAFLALVLASLLNAQGLRKTAVGQPEGIRREISLAVTRPLVDVSHFLFLDRPRHELQVAIGRADEDRVDTTVALPPPPPKPKPAKPRPVVPAPPPVPATTGAAEPAPPKPKPKPSPKPKLPAFSPQHPLRVWVAGDSLIAVPGQSLERATGRGGAVDVLTVESRVSTGLTRPDVFNWFTRMGAALVELRPKVAVLSFGADDDHNYMAGLPSGASIGPLGSRTWIAEYHRRVAGVTQQLTAAGVYVVWLGLPITRGEGRNSGYRVINRVLSGVAKEYRRSASYVDAWKMFQDPHGRYADYLRNTHGQLVLMRSSDGVHYQPAAGDLLARVVLHRLNTVFDLTSWKRHR